MDSHESSDPLFGTVCVPLLRIRGTYPTVVCPTGPTVSVWMHWLPEFKRSMPCVRSECPHCAEGFPRRPLSYVPALLLRSSGGVARWSPVVLELPLRAGIAALERRGQCVSLRRTKHQGPVELLLCPKLQPPSERGTVSVFETLFSLWRIPRSNQITLVSPQYNEN